MIKPDKYVSLYETNQYDSEEFNKIFRFFAEKLFWEKNKSIENWGEILCLLLSDQFLPSESFLILKTSRKHVYSVASYIGHQTTYKNQKTLKINNPETEKILQKGKIRVLGPLPEGLEQLVDKKSEESKVLLLPFYSYEDFLGVCLLHLDDEPAKEKINLLHQLQDLISASLRSLVNRDTLQKEINQLKAMNDALESSQQAMHENAVKFLQLHKLQTDSIRYAQKIQNAILPTKYTLSKVFDDYFTLYLPKDIVSGDFYWFSQVDYTFLAVVDCTGHGVPGAFMSVIGHTLFNEIVNIKRVSDPAKILSLLHDGVKNALKQDETNNSDGMDVCLIRLERDDDFQLHLTFAGAKRPLYLMRDGQLLKIKGNRESIGGWKNRENIYFKNHELILKPRDILYLTTDGFVDTPNEKRKGFGKTRFQELIIQSAQHPLSEQKELFLNALKYHQKNSPQRDDITIVALKV